MRFKTYSYRFAEQVLNSKLSIRKEIEETISSVKASPNGYSRPELNEIIRKEFLKRGWEFNIYKGGV